jgi:hypothetical protein
MWPRTLTAVCICIMTCSPALREPHADDVAPPETPLLPDTAPPLAEAPTQDTPFYQPDPNGRPVVILRRDAPNMRYASLDAPSCEAELGKRAITFARGEPTPGVLAPVRLRGPLHGVAIHSNLPLASREHAAMEIFDCRLVLALDDLAAMVAERGVVEMIHLSAYRPRAQFGCTPKYAGKQHCAALAVDVATFKLRDGGTLDVQRDFHGRIGQATCGELTGPNPATEPAKALWAIVCDAAARATFHVILTPNFNAQHVNHFHFEITPNAGWMLIH